LDLSSNFVVSTRRRMDGRYCRVGTRDTGQLTRSSLFEQRRSRSGQSSRDLDKPEIQRTIGAAEAHAAEDARRDKVGVRNEADSTLYRPRSCCTVGAALLLRECLPHRRKVVGAIFRRDRPPMALL
jgi:hypothetical protein